MWHLGPAERSELHKEDTPTLNLPRRAKFGDRWTKRQPNAPSAYKVGSSPSLSKASSSAASTVRLDNKESVVRKAGQPARQSKGPCASLKSACRRFLEEPRAPWGRTGAKARSSGLDGSGGHPGVG